MGKYLTAETIAQARLALEHERADILLHFPEEWRDSRLKPILAALSELDEYAPLATAHRVAQSRCPQCGGHLELVDDTGYGDGMRPRAWCTWVCESCRWIAGYAKTPELADRVLERKIAQAWQHYDANNPTEFPPPTN